MFNATNSVSIKTKELVILSMFSAIIVLLSATPIGFINLGFIKATIIHIPVIVGSIIMGPRMGSVLGLVFGMTSLINNTMTPVVSSFVFSPFIPVPSMSSGSPWALLICFVPRILVGIVPWYIYQLSRKLIKNKKLDFIGLTIAGVVGSATNTLLVMNLIYLLFKEEYATIRGVAHDAVYGIITSIIIVNGVPEAIVAGILTTFICKTLLLVKGKND